MIRTICNEIVPFFSWALATRTMIKRVTRINLWRRIKFYFNEGVPEHALSKLYKTSDIFRCSIFSSRLETHTNVRTKHSIHSKQNCVTCSIFQWGKLKSIPKFQAFGFDFWLSFSLFRSLRYLCGTMGVQLRLISSGFKFLCWWHESNTWLKRMNAHGNQMIHFYLSLGKWSQR